MIVETFYRGYFSLSKGMAESFLVAMNPVKKHGPGIGADLRLATPLGDPV